MFSVYLITNLVNGKVYVGKTKRKLYTRWLQHLSFSRQNRKTAISLALRKYGSENFTIHTIQTTSDDEELDRLERDWIFLMSSRVDQNGYNMTPGGDGGDTASGLKRSEKTVTLMKKNHGRARRDITTELVTKLYNDGLSVLEICKKLNAGESCVRARMKDSNVIFRPNRSFLGRQHTQETIHKMSIAANKRNLDRESKGKTV